MIPLEQVNELERLVASISSEAALVHPGKDDGLVPGYTLLGELIDLLEGDEAAKNRCQMMQDILGQLLDEASPFDDPAVEALLLYVDQLQCLLRYFKMETPITWDQLESQWDYSTVGDSTVDEVEGTVSAEDLLAEVAKDDSPDVLMYLDLQDNREVLEEFYDEAIEHLDNIEAAMLDLESDPNDAEGISSVFRSFHTIKGVSGFLSLTPIRVLSHEVETLLDRVRSHEQALTSAVVEVILDSRDRLKQLISQIHTGLSEGQQPDTVIPVSDLITRTRHILDNADKVDDKNNGSASSGQAAGQDTVENRSAISALGAQSSIRMNTEKLDSIIDAVGELVIVESQLRDSILSGDKHSARIEHNLAQLGRITRELQRSGLLLRMVSLKPLFQKMQRLARDISSKSNKNIVFRTEGDETEMDRTVVEKIGDPLVHMIRNAMDHGIESPEERLASGKPEAGEVVLKASYLGDNIVLELRDNGRGISSEKVLKKAIERGLAQEGRNYSRDEILEFLFHPGFSTAEKVSDLSGRGVGMDVVHSNVEALHGKIEISSEEGEGSRFRILLPLTMAIIDGLLVRVGDERYILPVMGVNLTLKPVSEQIFRVQGRGDVIRHRDKIHPLLHLGDFFGISSDAKRAEDGVVVLIETDHRCFGLIVDELLHKQEVVVKNLGETADHPVGVSGGTILGDGRVSLILDPSELIGSHRKRGSLSVA